MTSQPFTFKQPFSMIIAGPTMSGKTCFMIDLLTHKSCIEPSPKDVLWCYGIKNKNQFAEIRQKSQYPVHFHEGLPIIEDVKTGNNTLIVLDDLMTDAGKSNAISQLFTRGMHHNNISVILITQNIFHQGKKMRDISLNSNYFVLFKNPRDARQISFLSSQMFPTQPKYLPDAFKQATERPHGYLVIDLTQKTETDFRLVTNIFPYQSCYFLIPKKTEI
jgi:hypothetical protein